MKVKKTSDPMRYSAPQHCEYNETKVTNRMSLGDVKFLEQTFTLHKSISDNVDNLLNFFKTKRIEFLNFLSTKLQLQDLAEFLCSLTFVSKESGTKIIEQKRKNYHYYIFMYGQLGLYQQTDSEELQMKIDDAEVGELYCPFPYLSPRYSNYTATCEDKCYFLCFNEQTYHKFIKKIHMKQIDETINFLKNNPFLQDVGTLNMRNYVSYFIKKNYKNNEIIYSTESSINYIYFIVEGQVQISTRSSQNDINVVKIAKRECFGIENIKCESHTHIAKNICSQLTVLRIHINLFEQMKAEFPIIEKNLTYILLQTHNIHAKILSNNMRIMRNKYELKNLEKKKKKRKKMKNKKNITLQSIKWWGLAQNLPTQHKYRLPQSVNKERQTKVQEGNPLTKKIDDLKKRVFENNIKEVNLDEDQKQNNFFSSSKSPWKTTNYVPKMKAKVKMLQAKPKAIDMADIIKKKLLNYAKNMGSFCDRLNLQ